MGEFQLFSVKTFSIHHTAAGFFPVSQLSSLPDVSSSLFDPFTLSLPLKEGASNSTYARIWPLVEDVKDIFNPDYIVVQCGVDGLAGDPCGISNWSLGSSEGSLGWCVDRVINKWRGKKLLLGGGMLVWVYIMLYVQSFSPKCRRLQLSQRSSCMDILDIARSKFLQGSSIVKWLNIWASWIHRLHWTPRFQIIQRSRCMLHHLRLMCPQEIW